MIYNLPSNWGAKEWMMAADIRRLKNEPEPTHPPLPMIYIRYDWVALSKAPRTSMSVLHYREITQINFYDHNYDPLYLIHMLRGISYDYDQMRLNTSVFKEELIATVFHPLKIIKWLELGWDPTDEDYNS